MSLASIEDVQKLSESCPIRGKRREGRKGKRGREEGRKGKRGREEGRKGKKGREEGKKRED